MRAALHAAMASLALAACAAPAAPQWEKPGATAAMVKEDSDQCGVKARLDAPQPSVLDRTGASVTTRILTVEEERRRNEVEYFQKCMQEKGYSAKR